MTMTKMTLKTEGDRHVVVTRRFAAPPEAVYRAHTEPSIIQKWLLGPDGWTMTGLRKRGKIWSSVSAVKPGEAEEAISHGINKMRGLFTEFCRIS